MIDSSFEKSTYHYRIRYPAKWACPQCLQSFPTWGIMNRHLVSKKCIRRAPNFNRFEGEEMWQLLTEKASPSLTSRDGANNYFNKMKNNMKSSSNSNKIGPMGSTSSSSSKNNISLNNASSKDMGSRQNVGGGSELSETSAALVSEANSSNLGGYWDPSGGLNKRGRLYESGIPPPEKQILTL